MGSQSTNDSIAKMVNYLLPAMDSDSSQSDNFPSEPTSSKRSAASINSKESINDEATPLKKFKLDSKFDMNYVGSPREMRRLRADLLEGRNTILNLENRIQHMHSVRKEIQIMFDNETRSLKRQHEQDRRSITELESQLQVIRKREIELRQELSEVKNNYDLLKLKTDQRIECLEKSLSESISESRAVEGQENADIAELNRKLMEMENVLQAAEEDADAHKKLAKELEKELSEKSSLASELEIKSKEIQKLRLKVKEYEYSKDNFLEFQEQAKAQANKLARYVQLEKENEKLIEENNRIKDDIKNKLILEEEVYDLKNRLQKYKDQENKYNTLQMLQVQSEMYLEEWRAVARGVCEITGADSSLPHLLRSAVERLQQQELFLTEEKVTLQSKLTIALHDAKVAKDELNKIQELLKKMNSTDEQNKNLIHRMKKKLLLVSRERDSYRLQLDSYERDLTMCINSSALGTSAANQLQSQKEQIENLKKIISGYQEMVSKLENDLQGADPNIDVAPVRIEQMSRLQQELTHLKSENERLKERKDQLEIQLEEYLVGNDSVRGGQIFHLANNPLAECLAQRENLIEKLEDEVDKLKRKVKNLTEGLEYSRLNDVSMSTKEVKTLKEELKNNEVQLQQLKDGFKSSMQEFREVVYMLFGYKIDKNSKSLYKLTSMYAECSEDVLCFQLNMEGGLDLLETEFSATLEDLIDLHLRHQNSTPLFLSSLTMDLYTNKTLATQTIID